MDISSQQIPQSNTNTLTSIDLLDSDQELDGLKNLDSQVIGAVYDRYFPDVYRFVYFKINDEQVTEDISSDVFVRLLEAIKRGRGPKDNLKGWLLSTASHAVADYFRRVYRRPTEELSEGMPDDEAQTLREEIDHRERVDMVHEAYAELTPDQQNVLALRFGDGYSLEETARLMQKNVNAIKALQFRALAALQRNIGEVEQ